MGHLSKIIKNLSREEVRFFKIYSKRINYGKVNKTVQLLDQFRKTDLHENDTALINQFFPNGSRNPYYRLKNKLFEEVTKSLLIQHFNRDDRNTILNLLAVSNLFNSKTQYEEAIYFLHKAEKKALQHEYYDLADLIYSELIAVAANLDKVNPLPYIEKQKENAKKLEILRQANLAISAVNYQLKKSNFSGKEKELSEKLKKILDDLSIANEVYNIPKVKLKIHECVRNFLLQRKDFEVLGDYLINSYDEFNREGVFSKSNHHEKIMMINWITNSQIKLKKFDKALFYAEQFYQGFAQQNKEFYDKYVWSYYQVLVISYFYSGTLDRAIGEMENLKNNKKYKGNISYELAVHLNLASLYHSKGDVTKSIRSLSKILIKDVYNNLSKQLKLSVLVFEMILHYEKPDFEYVHNKRTEIRRNFGDMLNQDEYHYENQFLLIFNKIIKDSAPFKNKNIVLEIEEFLRTFPEMEPASNEIIHYNAWLASKISNRSYYDTIIDMMK